jgi:hypothetical protein
VRGQFNRRLTQVAYHRPMLPRVDWLIATLAVAALIATIVLLAHAMRPVPLFAPHPMRLEAR